jgi:hypothetical protein
VLSQQIPRVVVVLFKQWLHGLDEELKNLSEHVSLFFPCRKLWRFHDLFHSLFGIIHWRADQKVLSPEAAMKSQSNYASILLC